MLALMFLCPCIFGEGWPLSAPVLGLLVGRPCVSHFVEQSGMLVNPRAMVQECKDRAWRSCGAPECGCSVRAETWS